MPTYDYACRACEHTFEEFQSMSEPVLTHCPECVEAKLERLIGGGAGVLVMGSCYYVTDNRSDSYRAGESADKPSAPT